MNRHWLGYIIRTPEAAKTELSRGRLLGTPGGVSHDAHELNRMDGNLNAVSEPLYINHVRGERTEAEETCSEPNEPNTGSIQKRNEPHKGNHV